VRDSETETKIENFIDGEKKCMDMYMCVGVGVGVWVYCKWVCTCVFVCGMGECKI
jgi:hypothetical protein